MGDVKPGEALDLHLLTANLLRARDPEFAKVTDDYFRQPYDQAALSPKVSAMVVLAAESVIPQADYERMALALKRAKDTGCSADEVLCVLEISCSLGLHTVSVGLPILLEEMTAAGIDLPAEGERYAELKEYFEVQRVRTRELEGLYKAILLMDPEYFEQRLRLIDLPWEREGILDHEIKHLISIAIDVVCPNLFVDGIRLHIRQSLAMGIAPERLFAVIQLASATSLRTLDVALPILDQLYPR